MKFKALIESEGKTAAGITIPNEVVESLSAGKKPPVKVTINGYTYQNTVATMNGIFKVSVSEENRRKGNITPGEIYEINIELDTDVREVAIPKDLEAELNKNPRAKELFQTLSNSKKKWIVMPMEQAKTQETRQKRIDKVIAMLNTEEFSYKI